MNELQYEELLSYAKSIGQFKQMVSSESKRPIAVRALMYVVKISSLFLDMLWQLGLHLCI